jgi:DME family drug/metabolite transporter
MQKLHTFRPDGFWLVTSAAILWGTIGIVTQAIYNLDSTSSLFINLARTAIAAPVLLVMGWRVVGREMFDIRQRDFVIMLLSGALLALSQAAYFAGLRHVGVTIATLLTICLSPLVVTLLSVLLKLETLTRRMVAALIWALAGSALLTGVNPQASAPHDVRLGILFSVVAAVFYAGMVICGRFLAEDYHSLQVTAIAFSAGVVVLLVLNLASGIVVIRTARGWLLAVYLGLIPTALAYWLFQVGLHSVSATTASIVAMLDPLVAALLAWGLLGETMNALGLLGAALLMLSLWLLSAQEKKSSALANLE